MNAWRAQSLETVTPQQRAVITISVMLASLLHVLDTTIVNVALPHMKGQLGASSEQINWVLTSYVVATTIFIPLSGFLTDRFGVRAILLISVVGFTLSSVLCGVATTLPQMVTFRIFQGITGAPLVPLAQAVMMRSYPLEDRGKAMSWWGMGVMIGPIIGPTLGGWITEHLSWHWNFFINVPVGIVVVLLLVATMPKEEPTPRRMDWSGFLLMAVALASLQFVLDLGEREDWFDSELIQFLALLALVGFAGFIWHGLSRGEDPLFDLHIFKDRNYTPCLLICILMMGSYFSLLFLLPLLMVDGLHFNTTTVGLLLAPRGLATIVSTMAAGRLIKWISPSVLIIGGALMMLAGFYPITQYNLDTTPMDIVWPGVIQGLGMGFIVVSFTTVAYVNIPKQLMGDATAVFSLMRSLGIALGLAITSTFFGNRTQAAWAQLRQNVTDGSLPLSEWLQASGLHSGGPETWALAASELGRQAQMVGFTDAFKFATLILAAALPFALLIESGSLNQQKEVREREEAEAQVGELETEV